MTLLPVSSGDPHVPAHNAERDAINALQAEVDQRIPFPTGALTGDLLRWDGAQWVTTETRFFEGVGRPEGNFAAPVGSRYIDKNAAQGAVEWVKRSGGDSAFGWLVLAGDTGLRDISSVILKPAGSFVYAAHVRRIGHVVDMFLNLRAPSAGGTWTVFNTLAGFGPGYSRLGLLQDYRENRSTGNEVTSNGGVVIHGTVAGKSEIWNGTWLTPHAWPTSLPGSAA